MFDPDWIILATRVTCVFLRPMGILDVMNNARSRKNRKTGETEEEEDARRSRDVSKLR